MFFNVRFLEAVGVISGMIIGSGMFALPYAVKVSGLFAAAISSLIAFLFVLLIHLAYGEIVINADDRHRLPGYAKYYLGKWYGHLSKLSQLIGFNMALIIYGALGGIFLGTIFGGSAFLWTLIFFAICALILLIWNIEQIGFINFILAIPLIFVTLVVSFLAVNKGHAANLSFPGTDPFFSFGVFVFALAGLSVIADARDIFSGSGGENGENNKSLKSAIITGTILPYCLYAFFITGVLMAAGSLVSGDSISSLAPVLGRVTVKLGALVGLIAVFTSYLALGYDLKEIYKLDFGFGTVWSRALVFLVPVAVFAANLVDSLKLISIVGGLFLAADALFVIFILRRQRLLGENKKFLSFGFWQQGFLLLIAGASIAYEIVYQIIPIFSLFRLV